MRWPSGLTPVVRTAILLLVVHGPGGSSPLWGQQEEGQQEASLLIEEEQLVRFAKAHIAITEAQEAFSGELARTHDSQGKARLREALSEKLTAIMEEHEMTSDTFERLTAVISANAQERARFEKVLEELRGGSGGARQQPPAWSTTALNRVQVRRAAPPAIGVRPQSEFVDPATLRGFERIEDSDVYLVRVQGQGVRATR